MKRIFLFFFFALVACLFSQKSFAQGNLQFNQVLTQTVTLTGTSSSSVLTVPAGKVWKIEQMLDTYSYAGTSGYFKINGKQFYIHEMPNSTQYITKGPIWLKAGDTFCVYNTASGSYDYFYSIIEFNIVP